MIFLNFNHGPYSLKLTLAVVITAVPIYGSLYIAALLCESKIRYSGKTSMDKKYVK